MNEYYENGNDNINSGESFDNYSSVRDASQVSADYDELFNLCQNVTSESDIDHYNPNIVTWETIRVWIRDKDDQVGPDGFSVAEKHARFRSSKKEAALHVACKNKPPLDIVKSLIGLAPDSPSWSVDEGWLALHVACFFGSSLEVLQELISKSPDSTCSTDQRGRTPVMFALKCNEKYPFHGAASISSLTQGGASAIKDINGMLPLHYASAHGASDRVIDVLTSGYTPGVEKTDNLGRTPLHLAMVNSDKKTSPSTVKKLIALYPEAINILDGQGSLPIQLLSKGVKDKIGKEAQDVKADRVKAEEVREKKRNTQRCLEDYLAARPRRTFDLLKSLETLPEWLRKFAATTPHVRFILNKRIVDRFPTLIMLLDGYFLVFSIIAYRKFCFVSTEKLGGSDEDGGSKDWMVPLIVCMIYFTIREVMKLASFLYLGLFFNWMADVTNWIRIIKIVLILFSLVPTEFPLQVYKGLVIFSTVLLWTTVLIYLRATIIEFAVFVGGVIYVFKRLAPFLVCLFIVLLAFSQMFYTIFMKDTEECVGDDTSSFCNYGEGFFKVYTMLVGEVNDKDFDKKPSAMFLYILYALLVVILLANVLIAIVGESYEFIKTQRAEEVFWSNRLYFLTEIDALVQFLINNVFCCLRRDPTRQGMPPEHDNGKDSDMAIVPVGPFSNTWKRLCLFVKGDEDNIATAPLEIIVYLILRGFAVTAIIIWIALGIVTFGLLWPPQISYFIFVSSNMRRSKAQTADTSRSAAEFRHLKEDVKAIKELMRQEVEAEREKLEKMRVALIEEMKQIHHLLETLTEDFLGGK